MGWGCTEKNQQKKSSKIVGVGVGDNEKAATRERVRIMAEMLAYFLAVLHTEKSKTIALQRV